MPTKLQLLANRRNAKSSKGPKTNEGKAVSAKNSITHGLLAKNVLIPGDDQVEFESMLDQLRKDLNPQDEMERFLVDRIVALAWRLKRCGRFEAAVIQWHRYLALAEQDLNNEIHDAEVASRALELSRKLQAPAQALAGDAFVKSAEALSKLSRYEAAIERSFFSALHELQRHQAARQGQAVALPQALDLNISGDVVLQANEHAGDPNRADESSCVPISKVN